jgi:hypothetical protein
VQPDLKVGFVARYLLWPIRYHKFTLVECDTEQNSASSLDLSV